MRFTLLLVLAGILCAQQTSVTLTTSANPTVFGQPLTLTATVAPSSASGSVTFYDGTTVLGTKALVSGQASLTTGMLASGVRSLKAYYGGGGGYAPGVSAALVENVNAVAGNGFLPALNYSAIGAGFIATGDFNGDGRVDLVIPNHGDGSVSVLLNNGDGTFRKAVSYGTGDSPAAVTVGDFNGDGKLDLAVVNAGSNTVSVLLGNGDGTFQAAVSHIVGTNPYCVTVADFNGDGRLDLAVGNSTDGTVSVLLGNGDGTFQIALTASAVGALDSLVVADFNGDGKPDLAVTGWESMAILLGNGDGTFQSPAVSSDGGNYSGVVVGDFNGDGKADLVTCNPDVGYLRILLGNGDGTFQSALKYPFTVGTGSVPVVVADFNGDGKADLAIAYIYSPSVMVALGNGDGTFQPAGSYKAGNYAFSLAVGDFNGDGRADLAVTDVSIDSVSVLLAGTALPPSVVIDSPAAGATVASGKVVISGWAIDNISSTGTAIASVVVKVDGTVAGNASYGISRPDVCAAFPDRPGCPNVGYSYSLNTASLSNGTHTVTVSATDSDGTPDIGTASVTITVSNLPPVVAIDSPMQGSVLSGVATVSGWAIDSSASGTAISGVQVKVDGVVVGTATYGIARPDVCSAYPSRPGCPNVGYSYQLNASILAAGPHTITVTATDSDGTPDVGSASVTATVAMSPPSIFIDSPTSGAVLSGTATVSGWAIDSTVSVGTAIGSVVVKVDGNVAGNATYGTPRPDVCGAYPGRPGCPNVGFTYALDTTKLTSGSHTLTAVATDTDGNPDSGSWTVAIQVSAPPTVIIDTPAAGVTIGGTVTVSGWALDSATAIGSVQIKVDGAVVGSASYGVARPDVCAVFPGRPGCPNVGFTFQLNASPLRAGMHTITAVATDTDGTPDMGTYTVTVSGGVAPPMVYVDSLANGAMVSGTVTVSGWAIDDDGTTGTPIASVQVKVDGNVAGNATYGTPRPDVCAAFPGRAGCPNVGFSFVLNTASLSSGSHTITVVATDTDATPDSGSYSVSVVH